MPYSLFNLYLNVSQYSGVQPLADLPDRLTLFLRTSTRVFFAFLVLLPATSSLAAETTETETQAQDSNDGLASPPQIAWSVDQSLLELNHQADESLWLETDTHKSVVLKYRAKSRKLRGRIILLHAQGEHADHTRLIKPLAVQFSQLGWQVFIPNLPLEDFPYELVRQAESTEQNNEQPQASENNNDDTNSTKVESNNTTHNSPTNFFSDAQAYQQYIDQLISQLIQKIGTNSDPLVLIGNQNSALWMLESTKSNDALTQAVLLEPQLPPFINKTIEYYFKDQKIPVYTFIQNSVQSTPFIEGFDRHYWKAKFQRRSKGIINSKQIDIEDSQIAKAISGWVDIQTSEK